MSPKTLRELRGPQAPSIRTGSETAEFSPLPQPPPAAWVSAWPQMTALGCGTAALFLEESFLSKYRYLRLDNGPGLSTWPILRLSVIPNRACYAFRVRAVPFGMLALVALREHRDAQCQATFARSSLDY